LWSDVEVLARHYLLCAPNERNSLTPTEKDPQAGMGREGIKKVICEEEPKTKQIEENPKKSQKEKRLSAVVRSFALGSSLREAKKNMSGGESSSNGWGIESG